MRKREAAFLWRFQACVASAYKMLARDSRNGVRRYCAASRAQWLYRRPALAACVIMRNEQGAAWPIIWPRRLESIVVLSSIVSAK